MSKMAELAWDIEQMWIEGKNPVEIAGELDCHVDLVNDWLRDNNLHNWDHYSDLPSPAHYDGWQSVETSVPEEERPLYIGLLSTEEIQKHR